MSDQVYLSKKAPAQSNETPAPNPLQSRPFPVQKLSLPQQKTPETREQLERSSRLSHNFLKIPVNPPGTPPPPPPIQPKFTYGGLTNPYQQQAAPVTNPLLNQLKVQQFSQGQTVQQKALTERQDSEFKQQEEELESLEEQQNSGKTPEFTSNRESPSWSKEAQAQPETLEAKKLELESESAKVTSNKEQQKVVVEGAGTIPLEAKTLSDRSLETQLGKSESQVNSNVNGKLEKTTSQIPTGSTQTNNSNAVEENKSTETDTGTEQQLEIETPVENTGSTKTPPPSPAITTSTGSEANLGGGAGGQGNTPIPQEAVPISAEDPGQILEQLKNTPATQSIATYAQAQTASAKALEKQRQNVQETIPEIPAPTGLPAQKSAESGKAAQTAAENAAVVKAAPVGDAGVKKAGQDSLKYDSKVPEAPLPPPATATQLAGGNVAGEGESDPALSQSAQNALANVSLDTNQVSTSAGERPNVDLTGEADPSQMAAAQTQSSQQVQQVKAKAAQDINQDFGEKKIFPEASNETLKANKELSAVAAPTGKIGEAPALPGELVGGLNQSLSPFLREKIGAEQEKYQAGKEKGEEKSKGEKEASKHLEEAEQKAEAEKQKADSEAGKKKQEAEKESGGFWGWVKSKAKALIDGLKQAVNFIYDNLRKAVKAIFEAAKKLAVAAIDLARQAIVGLIKGFGEILKGLVKVVFAAFPNIAKKITAKIDQAINKAVKAVNAAADLLKKGVSAVLGFLANTLDTLLAALQAIYNAVIDAVGAVINALLEVMQKIGHLVSAAKQMPDHFWGQMSEEVMGMDVTQPLPFERTQDDCATCNAPAIAENAAPATVSGGGASAEMLNKTEFTDNDIAVEQVAPFDVDPEFLASTNLSDGGEVEFGESNDPANSMEAIKAELVGQAPAGITLAEGIAGNEAAVGGCCDDEQTAQAKLEQMMTQKVEGAEGTHKSGESAKQGDIPASMKTIGPLSPGQRSQYLFHQLKQGIQQWFAANWGKLLAGAIAGITGFVAANIITGGAVMAAVPPLLQILGAVMVGVSLAQIAGHIGNYVSQGWAGEIAGAAKSLARAVAVGAIELVFALLFSAGAVIKALKGGIKGATKAAATSVKTTVKATAKSIKELGEIGVKGAKTTFKNGKIMLQGVKGGFAKGAKSIDDLAERLSNKLRFNKFKIRRQGLRIQLLGHINPWILLADGSLKEVSFKGQGRKRVGDVIEHEGQEAIVVGIKNQSSISVQDLQQSLPRLRETAKAQGWSDEFLDLYNVFSPKRLKTIAKKIDDLPKTAEDWIQWAANNPGKVKGLDIQGLVREYGSAYPEAVNRFLTQWFSGQYTRYLSNSQQIRDLNSLGIPKEVLENIAQDSELRKLALMMRPSNPAHAKGLRQRTLPKPGTATIEVPSGTSMQIKDLAKNAGPSPNPDTGFYEVTIKVDGNYQSFAFAEDSAGTLKLLPSEQATGLKPADYNVLKNSEQLIPLPEGKVTTSISSMYTPPVSTSRGKNGMVGARLYRDGKQVQYLAVSPDGGKTYYLEDIKNILDEQGNFLPGWEGKVVGSDIDLLAVLSRDGKLNSIADIKRIAQEKPELFNALLEAFSTERKGIGALELEGSAFKFPSAATDIQHGAQIPFLADKLLEKVSRSTGIPLEELKTRSTEQLKSLVQRYRNSIGEQNFKLEIEKIIGVDDGRTVLTIKGRSYTIPIRDVPMLYKILGYEFPVAAYLPI
ncbi:MULTISPECIES: hypothetical protein [unclassified Coleofasciculus]|uniref:hypothetical protein n=1 Tax=unclassified Coleofasciculus TaxID=2692782 RepID=UPI001880FF3C|nr:MULTISPECIES: hypothetical protein [unclassified Coleofasciculus]MBE9126182.1 hypothetical protein [Coleofasciculus sp. LEGE 07081]MBE9149611.1 hypothetical protein [Coleofasciculus sp. LEGE 07092]